jgi:hypothetical protein
MLLRWLIVAPLTCALGLAVTVPSQFAMDKSRDEAFDEELLYLPNEHLLTHFTGGMNTIVADLLWLRCIQYTAEHFRGDGKFVWLDHMCRTITDLDPNFVPVYRFGGIFLAALKADDDASIELLRKGIANNPEAWELSYEAAMIYLLNRRDRPESPAMAAQYLAMSVETGEAPEFVMTLAESLSTQHDLGAVERQMWANLAEGDDKFMSDLAQRKLIELQIREQVALLNEAMTRYADRHGTPAATLDELITGGILSEMPQQPDPLGGRYVIDGAGDVQNTTLLDAAVDRRLNRIRADLRLFQREYGHWPETLDEVVEREIAGFVPPHPYDDRTWSYDPATGEVE